MDGTPLRARVCGRPMGTVWEGWLEFISADGERRRTPRETTQPDRRALEYWASGLSPTYLEGAFLRTSANREPAAAADESAAGAVETRPMFDGPPVVAGAVLDPFSVAVRGEDHLRRELLALSDWHLRSIVRAYDLAEVGADLESLTLDELVDLIVDAVLPED
jgi:hypothetical protein